MGPQCNFEVIYDEETRLECRFNYNTSKCYTTPLNYCLQRTLLKIIVKLCIFNKTRISVSVAKYVPKIIGRISNYDLSCLSFDVAVTTLSLLFRFYLGCHSGRQLTLQPQMVRK